MAEKLVNRSLKTGINASEGPPKPVGKLSSGIMGMKFMQNEETSDQPTDRTPESQQKFKHDDPGAWFGHYSDKFKNATPKSESKPSVVGYADLYETPSGRKMYGKQPETVDAEDLVKSYSSKAENDSLRNRKKRTNKENLKSTRSKKRKSL